METVIFRNFGNSLVILSYALASRKTALLSFSFTLTLVQLFFFAFPPFLLAAEADEVFPLSPLPPLASFPFCYCFGPYKQKLNEEILLPFDLMAPTYLIIINED